MSGKKFLKIIAAAGLAGSLCAGGFALSGCGWTTETVSGEYHYANAWNDAAPDYGVKVNVEVQTDDKGDRIRKVTIAESEYVPLSSEGNGWTAEDRQNYLENEQTLLNAYRGLYVADVLAYTVPTDASGGPLTSSYPSGAPVITGATQSSGRLLLAVQNALLNFGYEVKEGEYSYPNPWAPYTTYGIAVKVILKDNVIKKVVTVDSEHTEVSDNWEDRTIWLSGEAALLDRYKDKTAEEVLAVTVTTDEDGTPAAVSNEIYNITGATQSSGRLLLAVQNALGGGTPSIDMPSGTYEGEYHYNSWGTEYGVKVSVAVDKGIVTSVTILESDYTNVTSPDKWSEEGVVNYNQNLGTLLSAYNGMTVQQVLALDVETESGGAPNVDSYPSGAPVITGATQSSGRLLLAVQNALENYGE